MDIVETARIKLVIDGKEGGNELDYIKTKLKSLEQERSALLEKRNELQRKGLELSNEEQQRIKEINGEIKQQEKLYRTVEQRMDVTKMTLNQLRQYQKDLGREMRQLEPDSDAFNKVAGRLKEVNTRVAEVNGAIKSTNDEVKKQPSLWEQAKGAFAGFLAAFTLTALIGYLKDLAARAWDAVNSFDRMHMALKNVSTSQEEYKNNLQFLNKLSNDYGQNLGVITKSYTGFLASTKSTNLSLQEKQRIYESVIKAGSALTMSNEQIEGSLLAMSQMFSKGNVQAEELRGQLGERLPGAFGIMAKALGVNEQQLNKMLEQGQVLAEDALPKFATALEEVYGSKAQANLNTYQGSMNRLGTVVTNMLISLNEKIGVTKGVATAINWVADNLQRLVGVVKVAAAGFVTYMAATKGMVALKTAMNALFAAEHLLMGQGILLRAALTGSTNTLSVAQLRAAASAKAFNAALIANPIGLAIGAVTALVSAYVLMKDRADEAHKAQVAYNQGLAAATQPLKDQQEGFNKLASEVLNVNATMEDRESALKRLKDMHPDQLKGIDTIKQAELKLGQVINAVNGEYSRRIQLAELVYKSNQEEARRNKYLAERIELEEKLKQAQADANAGGLRHVYNILTNQTQIDVQARINDLKALERSSLEYTDSLAKQSSQLTETLTTNAEKQVEVAAAAGKARKDAAVKLEREIIKEWESLQKEFQKLQEKYAADFSAAKARLGNLDLKAIADLEKEKQKFYDATDKLITKGLENIKQAKEKYYSESEERLQLNTNVINEWYQKQQHDLLEDIKFKALNARDARDKEEVAQEYFGKKYTKLTKEQQEVVTKIVKDNAERRQEIIDKSFQVINAVADAAMSIYGAIMSDKMDEANTNTERALLENQQMWVQWGTQATSVVQAWMKDWVSGLTATIAWAGQGVANLFTAGKRKRKAELEDLRIFYEAQISLWRDFVDGANSDIEKYFGTFMDLTDAAVEYTEAMSSYDPKFIIDNEIKRAAQIIDSYEKAAAAELDSYNKKKDNINSLYDQEAKRINETYNLKQRLADQDFSAASNAILQGQANSLLGLISNKETRDSLTGEYASKLQQIKEIFSLADQQISDGMSQAQVDAINAARDARESAIADLENWYITELEFAVTSEGQKRKEYSETEKIRIEAEEALDKLKHEKTVADIKRNHDKNEELLAAEKTKNEALLLEEAAYNDKVLKLTLAKDEAIKTSWELVKNAAINGYDQIVAAAQKAYAKGVMTLEQYRALIEEANKLRGQYGENSISTTSLPNIDYSIDNNASKTDKRFMKEQGLWAEDWSSAAVDAYRRWLQTNNLQDSPNARIEFFMKQGNVNRYASGTEYVDSEGKFPEGVDTVPAFLTKGEGVLNPQHNAEKIAMGLNNAQLLKMARIGVVARNGGMLKSFQNNSIAQTGMPAYSQPTTTFATGRVQSGQVEKLLVKLVGLMEDNNAALGDLQELRELKELKRITKAVQEKEVLSLRKINTEQEADVLNRNRSTFQ